LFPLFPSARFRVWVKPENPAQNCAAVIKDEVHLSDEHKPSELEV